MYNPFQALTGIGLVFFLTLGPVTFIIFGWALVELTVEFFKKHPWEGIRYGSTSASDAITKAMLGEDYEKRLPSRIRPQVVGVGSTSLRQMPGAEFGEGFHPGLDGNTLDQPYEPDNNSFTRR